MPQVRLILPNSICLTARRLPKIRQTQNTIPINIKETDTFFPFIFLFFKRLIKHSVRMRKQVPSESAANLDIIAYMTKLFHFSLQKIAVFPEIIRIFAKGPKKF